MQRTDSVKWERTLDFICVVVVVVCYVSGREGQEWRSGEVVLPFLSPSPFFCSWSRWRWAFSWLLSAEASNIGFGSNPRESEVGDLGR